MKTYRSPNKPSKLQAAKNDWQGLNKKAKRQKRTTGRGKQWAIAEAH